GDVRPEHGFTPRAGCGPGCDVRSRPALRGEEGRGRGCAAVGYSGAGRGQSSIDTYRDTYTHPETHIEIHTHTERGQARATHAERSGAERGQARATHAERSGAGPGQARPGLHTRSGAERGQARATHAERSGAGPGQGYTPGAERGRARPGLHTRSRAGPGQARATHPEPSGARPGLHTRSGAERGQARATHPERGRARPGLIPPAEPRVTAAAAPGDSAMAVRAAERAGLRGYGAGGAGSKMESKRKATGSSAKEELIRKLRGSPKNLELVSQYVKEKRGRVISFDKPQRFQLTICGLDETYLKGQPEVLGFWEALYLPKLTKMAVLGTVDDVPCLATGQQLIILVAEDCGVYAYEEEVLHRLGKTLEEFLRDGLQLFGQEIYPCAEDLVTGVSLSAQLQAPSKEMWSEHRSGTQSLLCGLGRVTQTHLLQGFPVN
uniref:Uncharacterized protein n=1 Tax=Pelusios castaneus TaxID=367368 RepID=A0A8C8S493_9SAUR